MTAALRLRGLRPWLRETFATQFAAGHGWTRYMNRGAWSDDATDYVFGTQSAKIITSTTASQSCGGVKTNISPTIDATGKAFRVWFKTSDITNTKWVQIYVSSDNLTSHFGTTFLDSRLFSLESTTGGEWVTTTVAWADLTLTGSPNRAAINSFQLLAASNSTTPVTVNFGGLSLVDAPSPGKLSITFDDGIDSAYTLAKPVLDTYGYRATAYPILEGVGNAGNMTLANLQALVAAGWEIGLHCYDVDAHTTGYAAMTDANVQADWDLADAYFAANGLAGQGRVLAWPKGLYTPTQYALAAARFVGVRTIAGGVTGPLEALPPADRWRLRASLPTSANTPAVVNAMIDKYIAAGGWVILGLHKIVASGASGTTEYNVDDLVTIIDHVAEAGIAVATVGEMLDRNPDWVR